MRPARSYRCKPEPLCYIRVHGGACRYLPEKLPAQVGPRLSPFPLCSEMGQSDRREEIVNCISCRLGKKGRKPRIGPRFFYHKSLRKSLSDSADLLPPAIHSVYSPPVEEKDGIASLEPSLSPLSLSASDLIVPLHSVYLLTTSVPSTSQWLLPKRSLS